MANLFRCNLCNLTVIAEETKFHRCKQVVDYRIDGDILWLSDGTKWYPGRLMSPTRNQHDFKHGDDSTEPIFLIFCNGGAHPCPLFRSTLSLRIPKTSQSELCWHHLPAVCAEYVLRYQVLSNDDSHITVRS